MAPDQARPSGHQSRRERSNQPVRHASASSATSSPPRPRTFRSAMLNFRLGSRRRRRTVRATAAERMLKSMAHSPRHGFTVAANVSAHVAAQHLDLLIVAAAHARATTARPVSRPGRRGHAPAAHADHPNRMPHGGLPGRFRVPTRKFFIAALSSSSAARSTPVRTS